MEKANLPQKPKVFYGYWIVVAAFFCLFISSGCGFYAFSLFVKPLEAEFGWRRGEIMVAFTLFFLVMGVASPFIGRLVDHFGVRKLISVGALIVGLGFILLSLMNNLWQFYVVYAAFSIGFTAMGHVPATTMVSNWFKKRRGTAIGIMSIGIGIGGLALAPLIGGYLIPSIGWRGSYRVLALLVWILIIPLALVVVKTRPADMGLYPDGTEAPEAVLTKAPLMDIKGLTLKMALLTSTFWLVAITFMLSSFSHVGVIQNQVPHLQDIGFPPATAATALGVVGLASAIGKFGFGWVCDRMLAKYACAIGLSMQLAGIITLMNVATTAPAMIWLYTILIGLGAGSWLPTLAILISRNFGLGSYGAIFGMATLAQSVGVASGPLVAGYMYDTMNTFHWAFIIFAASYVIALPAILVLRRPKSV